MFRCLKNVVLGLAVLGSTLSIVGEVKAGVIVDKSPDLGDFWNPLSGSGTYVYANSFVFSGSTGTLMDTVGIYIRNFTGGPGSSFRFEVYADNANAPDPGNVLGVSNYLQVANPALSLITSGLLSPVSLVNGTRYWIAGSTVGQAYDGAYQVGGHTQNSIYNDNGTFWYSNDPAGQAFDGQALTPEMGIYASGSMSTVPEPSSLAMFGIATVSLAGYYARRRRKQTVIA